MNLFAEIPGNYNIMLAFLDILVLFLTCYMATRLFKRMTFFTAAALLFQLCIFTAGALAFMNRVILVPIFEIAVILLGIVIPSIFLLHDYHSMKLRIRKSSSDVPLIEKLQKEDKRAWKYQDFINEAEDWKAEIQAGIISANLSVADKHFKSNIMHEIHAAHKLIDNGNLTRALDVYRILSGIITDNPFIVYNAAWLMRKNGLYAESLKYHKKALSILGEAEESGDDEVAAGEEIHRNKPVQEIGAVQAILHFGCGMCCYALKKYELAVQEFNLAKKSSSDLREADINIAKSFVALGNLGEAEKHIRAALEEREDAILRFLLARICFENSQDMECKYNLEKILETNIDFTEAWEMLGKVYRKTGDWKGASNVYKKLTQMEPQDADYYYRLGVSLRQEGNTDEALSNFRLAQEINPSHSRALYSMASILDAQGKFDKAVECLNQSFKGDEKLEMAYNLLAEIHISLDRVYDAVHVYEEASIVHADSYVIHYNLGVTLMMVKRYEEAVRSFKRAQKLTSDDPALYYNWASAAISLKSYTEAAKLYKEGLKFKPDDDEILFGLARVSAISGDSEATIAFLSRAFDINPGLRLRAKASHDFASLKTLPEFMEITKLPEREERMHA